MTVFGTALSRHPYPAAVGAGILLHLVLFFRFASYARRGEVSWLVFAIVACIAGALVARLSPQHPFLAAACMIATMCFAQVLLMVADIALTDRTAHNLAPFELLFILFFGSAAFGGAAIGRLLD